MMVIPALWFQMFWDTIVYYMVFSLTCIGPDGKVWVPTLEAAIGIYLITASLSLAVCMGVAKKKKEDVPNHIEALMKFGVKAC